MNTEEELEKRRAFAAKLKEALELSKDVKSGGWDTPITHIRCELERWSQTYSRPTQY